MTWISFYHAGCKSHSKLDETYFQENPFASQEDIAQGEAIYQGIKQVTGIEVACAMCHGKEGKGDGPLAKAIDPNMNPTNFTDEERMKNAMPGQMFLVIKKGTPGTGMNSNNASDLDIWQLVAYIKSAFIKR